MANCHLSDILSSILPLRGGPADEVHAFSLIHGLKACSPPNPPPPEPKDCGVLGGKVLGGFGLLFSPAEDWLAFL